MTSDPGDETSPFADPLDMLAPCADAEGNGENTEPAEAADAAPLACNGGRATDPDDDDAPAAETLPRIPAVAAPDDADAAADEPLEIVTRARSAYVNLAAAMAV